MRWILIAALAVTVTTAAAAQRSHVGPHFAYNFDFDEAAIGAQMHLPIATAVELYPSFDYYLTDGFTLWGFNGDLKFRGLGTPLYFGGGVNFLKSGSTSDTGFNVFGGFERRWGMTHPYIEVRGIFHDNNNSLQMAFGLNLTLF